ncbi:MULTISPECIES: ATP-binding protein [unclassified Herbaspirillum]|uniref:ATP-binding protein n=1 Tax=unclassified Herbaspirillum TaxID=2624150 RepID=UPI00116901F8|nr:MULTISPECIES: ATP-binding protein [unclassified Herbaspirillum]MBB5392134.1 signal transduction histidine kinase [Herbaspirillum sp. SJZ102]TQK13591.1 signal transduction histidine kinase [Herbaspirillum sp. SJZ130]TQK15594.1 signal transduction histidine kinase [Herbaspirillum sp. SJZ106]TWC71493.1 signal transduction histidine kinase [Herbaspirillum sp. SJZ099]
MRLWPRTMAGQLIGLLLLGLVAAHAIGLSMVLTNGATIHAISRDQMVEHAAAAWRLGALPQAQARRALEAIRDDHSDYALDKAAAIDEGSQQGYDQDVIREKLQTRLGLQASDIRVSLVRHSARQGDLRIAMRVPDGQWINTLQHPVMSQAWMRPLRFSVPVSTLPVLVIVFLFVRRILRPIKALAHAAERVSRGEQLGPLPVSGPSEAREVTAAFNLMQERLTRFVEDRTRLLAAISHDLRTPITSLRLRAEMVEDAQLRAAMIRTLEEMRVMVEETVRFARDDARNEDTREVDLHALLRDVAQEQLAQGHDVHLRSDAPGALPYRCRPVGLKRAIGNLVDNAVRYGQRARLAVFPAAGGSLLIHVDDDGPGIAADQLPEVFKPFVRLDAARHRGTGKDGGSVGLGLAIARSCIEAHGGRLELENRDGADRPSGLRAVISLPA